MQKLTRDTLHGIWAGVTMAWDDRDRLDEDAYVQNTERLCEAGVHGIYTTGSTGEFYALDYEEFTRMVDIQADLCGRAGVPLQVGCCADNTRDVLRRFEYAASKDEVGGAQVTLPYWMELTDREMLQFFADVCSACPEMPLIHYNVHRANRFLVAEDYLRVLEVAPTMVGVKFTAAGAHFGDLQDALLRVPQLSFFVGENLLASAMQLGARGSCSSFIATNPAFMLTMYGHGEAERWAEAMAMQTVLQRFLAEAMAFIGARGEGMIDPVFDKGMAVASGCFLGSQRTRAPYIGWTDETVQAFGDWLQDHYPALVYGNAL